MTNPGDDEALYNKGLTLTKLERYREAWNLAIGHRDSRKSIDPRDNIIWKN